ncbi:Oidioi.mRNA.OKI2018_I69.chr2.g5269.t1.cds [Oikopleura dioica]|uniref:Oidioi.mRNA.OKI2018_I69.chr2.g5269.t1.cds n=1 Tax=Oikopleura dioica TaxID=34765 RepID=A0ABN7T465_OIKDI|nr:Oidioi.mRNA.OKI2018_I69.chr2.g5269.t1.cds [Oikopleura dioica]
MKLVEIDIDDILKGGEERLQFWSKIVIQQFKEVGFLRCVNIPGHDQKNLLEKANWFHLGHSEEQKMTLTTNRFNPATNRLYRGFFPVIKNQGSHKACFEIGNFEGSFEDHQAKHDPSSVASLMLEPAQWPEFEKEEAESLEFRKTVRAEFEVYHLVAKVLMECIAKGLNIDMEKFRSRTDKTCATFRLIHYPPRTDTIPESCKLPTGEIISTPEHHDTSILTVLENFNYAGLQVQDPKTEKWCSIETQPGSFVVNCGKILERMTGGQLRSTIHRVLDLGEERISAPFFYEPNVDADLIDFTTGEKWSDVPYGLWMVQYVKKFVEYKMVCGLTVLFFIFPECSIPMRSCRTKSGIEWFMGTKKRTRRDSYEFCSSSDSIIANISTAEKIFSENKEMLEKFGNFWLYDRDYEGELLIRSNGLRESTKSMAYYRPDKCITFQTDDQKALYECKPSDNYEYFMMLTIKEACFPMKPIWVSTMESIDIRVDADILKAVNGSRIDYINLQNHEIYNPRFCLTDRCCSMSADKEVKQFREHEKFYPLCVKL